MSHYIWMVVGIVIAIALFTGIKSISKSKKNIEE